MILACSTGSLYECCSLIPSSTTCRIGTSNIRVSRRWFRSRMAICRRENCRGRSSSSFKPGLRRVAELAEQLAHTRLVYVGDRESDMLELMVQAQECGHAADYLLRCQHNRALPEGGKVWAQVAHSPVLGELSFVLPPTKTRKSRSVRQQLRAKRVTLSDRRGGQLQVTCVIAA